MGKKILLADDSITIQKVIELTFSDEDFDVVTVGNGRLALEKLSEVRPDIVLCDIIMPEKDGYEVCEQIKKNPTFSHVPVLLLTGAFEPFDQERAARAGYDGSLAKPFEPETLIAKVRDLLARAPQRAQVAAPSAPPPVVPFARPTPAPAAPVFVPAPPPPAPRAESPSFISDEPFDASAPEPVPVTPPPPTPLREAPAPLAPMSEEESATLMAAPAIETEEAEEPQSTSTVMFKATDLPWNMAPAPVTAPTPYVKPPAPEPVAPSFVREPEQEFEPDALDAAEVVEETAVFEEVVEGDDLAFQTSGAAFDEVADSGGATVMFSSRTLPPTPPPTPPAETSATTASFVAREEEMTFEEPDLEPLPARDLEPEPEPEREPEPVRLVPPPPVFVPEPVPPPPPPPPTPVFRALTPPPMQAVRPPAPPPPPPVPPPPPRIEPPLVQAPPVESFADVASSVETTVPPMAPPISEAAAVAVPVEMVEKIAQRVVAQISEKAVREIAWEVIPDLAEALIKQEIERLKAELQKI
jgi:CheY-like chemotaxis protein